MGRHSVSIDNEIGNVELNGSKTVSPKTSTTYTITATGPGGSATAQTTVDVKLDTEHFTAVYGSVMDAESDTPLQGATVTANGMTATTGSDGQFQLIAYSGGTFKLRITKDGYTDVFRKITLKTGEEGVVDTAYLTAHDSRTTAIGPEGGTHANSTGTVEVIIPQGALSETKEIRITRYSGSKALPGDLNATDNLEYPIGFLFCADFGPDNTNFTSPVTIRVQNTWGFDAGTQIPYAYWDKDNQKWVPVPGMAVVDAQGQWLEAKVTHFSQYDINTPLSYGGGMPDFEFDPFPDDYECNIGSSVNVSTGALMNSFSVPGVNYHDGNTGLEFVYTSKTASPNQIMRVKTYYAPALVDNPDKTDFKTNSPFVASGGGSTGGSPGIFCGMSFGPNSLTQPAYGLGALVVTGTYPSGRKGRTGYHPIPIKITNKYKGEYYTTNRWGGMPAFPTNRPALESSYFTEERNENVFLISNEESFFGKGWNLSGLKKLHFDGEKVVVVEANGSYREFEKGINYADAQYGAVVSSVNDNVTNKESMLLPRVSQNAQNLLFARFEQVSAADGFDQTFIIDLGQQRLIEDVGLEFPQYWNAFNIWDYIKISSSLDKVTWEEWGGCGKPTLHHPAYGGPVDPLDFKIRSPFMINLSPRFVRYIKYQVGFPSSNSAHNGSAVYRVLAVGTKTEFRNTDEEKWPRLEYNSTLDIYTLTEFSGHVSVFDNTGKMTQSKDRQGRTITYNYDASGKRLESIIYPGNSVMEFGYDSNGFLTSVKDSTGRETRITPDSFGHIKSIVFPDNTVREFDYDPRGLMIMDKTGDAVKNYTWDPKWPVLTKVKLPNAGEREIAPAALKYLLNTMTSNADPSQDTPFISPNDDIDSFVTMEDGTKYQYTFAKGKKSVFKNSKHLESTYYANEKKNRIPVKILSGNDLSDSTEIRYNTDNQVAAVYSKSKDTQYSTNGSASPNTPWIIGTGTEIITRPQVKITYNSRNLVSNVSGPDTNMNYTYDANGNLTAVKNVFQDRTTVYTYNSENQLTAVQYPDGKTNQIVYDSNGLVFQVINNSGTRTTVTRNERGEVIGITDEAGRTTSLERDIMDRVIKETSPSGKVVRYEYGSSGCQSCGGDKKLTKIIDPASNTWEFKYDIMGNPIEMIYPDGTKIKQEFDIAGRLTLFTNKRDQEIAYYYDNDGRMTRKATPEGETVFGYDTKDRVIDIQTPDFHYTYQYGVPGGMGSSGYTLVQENNITTGQYSQIVYERNGFPVEYYDSMKWNKNYVYNFNQPGGTSIGFSPMLVNYKRFNSATGEYRMIFSYDKMDRLTAKRNFYLNTQRLFDYNTDGYLSRMRHINQDGYVGFPTIDTLLSRDDSGIITSMSGSLGLNVSYNSDLEITGVQHTSPGVFDESYSYDTNGNRLTSLTQSFAYDQLNRLTHSTTNTYQYDADGNLTEDKNTITGELKKYFYTSENRMVRYEHYASDTSPMDTLAEYKYDLYGRRLQKSVNGTITNFFWEGDNLAGELDSSYQPIRRYVYGAGMDDVEGHFEYSETSGNPLDTSKKGWYTYTKDQVGTVYRVFNDYTQKIVDSRVYDSFGNLASQTGTSKTNLGFQGKYFDQETGLYYYYHRYYSPSIGRFITEDPIGFNGGLNFYGFVGNNPVKWIDPLGLVIGDFPPPPPGLDDSWELNQWPNGKYYYEDPSEILWTAHKEDEGHWAHWDKSRKGHAKIGEWPENPQKKRPGQGKKAYGKQNDCDPSGNTPRWEPPIKHEPSSYDMLERLFRGPVFLPLDINIFPMPAPTPAPLPILRPILI